MNSPEAAAEGEDSPNQAQGAAPEAAAPRSAHQRRPRYRGTHPRQFAEKYKERNPDRYPDEAAKVVASGKTPAGQHLPIMVAEMLEVLQPKPGERVVDCTLGYGGHSTALWEAVQPDGKVLALDADPVEITRTEARLRQHGLNPATFAARRCNFAGILKAIAEHGWHDGADVIFADLGLSSMQIDNPARGFSFKHDGPLDMRMNPQRGKPASQVLAELTVEALARVLEENADEPRAAFLAARLHETVRHVPVTTTRALADCVRRLMPRNTPPADSEATVRRVFQALRIHVNDEFAVLDTLLKSLPSALRSGGRVAILAFHSGEDRRVKKALADGARLGIYRAVAPEVIRPSMAEQRRNPRSTSAKMRWAIRA